jgi:hypothetical protein
MVGSQTIAANLPPIEHKWIRRGQSLPFLHGRGRLSVNQDNAVEIEGCPVSLSVVIEHIHSSVGLSYGPVRVIANP